MRIRSIKPEFWTSEDVAGLAWEDRLLFIGLWSYVADSGVGRDNTKLIAADLFPLEDDPIETLAIVSRGLASLSAAGLITRYRVGNKRFLHITEWSSHQKIDRPTRSPFPAPTCEDAVFEESSRVTREPSPHGARDLGNKGSREQGISSDKSDHTDRFEEFWDTYSYKEGRKNAQTAYRAALKKPGVTPDLLISAAAAYIKWQCSEGKHPQFTKLPTSWLRGEHWTDERPGRPLTIVTDPSQLPPVEESWMRRRK